MTKIFSFIFIFFITLSFSQNLDWFYVMTGKYQSNLGDDGVSRVNSFALDDDENVYIAGSFTNNIGFDESNPKNFQLLSPVSTCYLVKIDKNKKYLWHKTVSIGSNSLAYISSIIIDKKGNIIVAGFVQGNNINLNPDNPSSPVYYTDSNFQTAIFINKYDKEGNFMYGSFYKGGSGSPKLSVDQNNELIVIGDQFNMDFDLSNQNYYLPFSSSFIMKNDENGKFKWAKYISGGGSGSLSSVKIDNKNNILTLINFSYFIDFNGEEKINAVTNNYGSAESFLLKITSDGNFIWAQPFGGINYGTINDSQLFDIDTDNSIVITTVNDNSVIPFPNQNVTLNLSNFRVVLYKIDENHNYLWHSSIQQTVYSQSQFPIGVSISNDHTINWSLNLQGVYNYYLNNVFTEQFKSQLLYSYLGTTSTLLKVNSQGKLIYNKHKILDHQLIKFDKLKNKIYLGGNEGTLDRNPDQNINDPVPQVFGVSPEGRIQKLDKCYSGTPDGDPYLYTCTSELKKIKDLYPKTTYSSWYDSPISTTPLSPETILETKKYYASVQDISCPFNSSRLEVDVHVFQNPADLIVSNFTFCNISGKQIKDLNINNNKNVQFFDSDLKEVYLTTYLKPNEKYYVRQFKEYYNPYWVTCNSNFTSFYVYDISTPPVASSSQSFCKIDNKRISDIAVNATNPKWYDASGNVISDLSTVLLDNTKYYVTQNSNGCESAKKEILITLTDPNAPSGNALQTFCSASNPTLKDLKVTGTGIKWYDSLGKYLPLSTSLKNNENYFASQTVASCESTSKLAVKVNIVTNYLSASDFSDAFCNDTTADSKTINLDDYKKQLIGNPQDYTFDFKNSLGISVSGSTPIYIGENIFDVRIKSSLGCYQDVKLKLRLDRKPESNLPAEREFCDDIIGVTLDAGKSPDPIYPYSYSWNTGETSQTIKADQEKIYSVTITTPFGCQNTYNTNVKKAKLAEIQNILITNNSITVIMSESGNYLYSLDEINWQISNKFENLKNDVFTVFVKNVYDCRLGSKTFTIFSLSNIFSPNDDGSNDTWKVTGIEHYPNSQIKIVDKNGRMVVNTITQKGFEWDGKFNGHKLPSDSYWYQIKLSDGRILEGYVVIKNRN